jgi:hypothetical protein
METTSVAEVRLEAQEWNQLLQILAQAPWNVANPLIMKIGEQLRAQQAPNPVPEPQEPLPKRSNSDGRAGHDAAR